MELGKKILSYETDNILTFSVSTSLYILKEHKSQYAKINMYLLKNTRVSKQNQTCTYKGTQESVNKRQTCTSKTFVRCKKNNMTLQGGCHHRRCVLPVSCHIEGTRSATGHARGPETERLSHSNIKALHPDYSLK